MVITILIYLKIGDYWIDPNDGDIRDAILVRCDAEMRSTCVYASPSHTPKINYVGNELEIWLNDIEKIPKVIFKYNLNYL